MGCPPVSRAGCPKPCPLCMAGAQLPPPRRPPKLGQQSPCGGAMPGSRCWGSVPAGCPLLTRGGAEGRLILELAALRHLGVAGLILACLRVWGGGGKQGVRGHGDSRPGWRYPLQTHQLQGQESSAWAAPGGGSARTGGMTVTCRDKLPAGKGRTRGGKVHQGKGRQGRAGKAGRSSVRRWEEGRPCRRWECGWRRRCGDGEAGQGDGGSNGAGRQAGAQGPL